MEKTTLLTATFLFLFLSGCIHPQIGDENGSTSSLIALPLGKTIKLHPDSSKSLIFFAPYILKGLHINISNDGEKFSDISLASSRIAITYFRSPDYIFVVDNYTNALMCVSISALLQAPVLLFGDTTTKTLEILSPTHIIKIGNVPVEAEKAINTSSQLLILTLSAYKERNIFPDYIGVIGKNPESETNPSEFGAVLTAFRNGITIVVNSTDDRIIKNQINDTINLMKGMGFLPEFISLIGGPDVIPHHISWQKEGEPNENEDQTGVPLLTDNYYGTFTSNPYHPHPDLRLGNIFIPEYSVGRVFAGSIAEAWNLLEMYINYRCMLADVPFLKNSTIAWKKHDSNYTGLPYTFSHYIANLTLHGFRVNAFIGNPDINMGFPGDANYIFLLDNVNESILSAEDILHPSVIFDGTSTHGQADHAVSFLNSGCAIYIAPIHHILLAPLSIGYGVDPIYPSKSEVYLGDGGAAALGRLFFEICASQNYTVGESLKWARYYTNEMPTFIYDKSVFLSFILYGDPAFNPYEPCNEGNKVRG